MLQQSLTQQILKPKNKFSQASQAFVPSEQSKSKTRTTFSIDFGTKILGFYIETAENLPLLHSILEIF